MATRDVDRHRRGPYWAQEADDDDDDDDDDDMQSYTASEGKHLDMFHAWRRAYSTSHYNHSTLDPCHNFGPLSTVRDLRVYYARVITLMTSGVARNSHWGLESRRRSAPGAEGSTPKESTARRRRRRGGWECGGGFPLPSRLEGLGERRMRPHWCAERSPGRNWIILYILDAKEAIWWHVLHWIFTVSNDCHYLEQDAQLSQRDRAAGCVTVFAKSRTPELGDNDLRRL